MGWQLSQTYSWYVVGCYAVNDQRISVPLKAENAPYGQVSAPAKVKSGQSRLRSAKNCSFRTHCDLSLAFGAHCPESP